MVDNPALWHADLTPGGARVRFDPTSFYLTRRSHETRLHMTKVLAGGSEVKRTQRHSPENGVPAGCVRFRLVYDAGNGKKEAGWFVLPLTEYEQLYHSNNRRSDAQT